MLIIYQGISVVVRTLSGQPQYVEIESDDFDFLNKFEYLGQSKQFTPLRKSNTMVVIDRRALRLLFDLLQR